MPGAVVTLASLTRSFAGVPAVRELSLEVASGELFGVVGPDGAGKTTLLRMLAGVLRPSSGDATVDGVSIAREPERVKEAIAYMSQRFGLYGDLTVAENLAFYADLFQVPRADRPARLERLYDFSGLGPFRDRLAGALSGGMKQKLGLSCALIHRPRLLLLDEPTFGVDPISRRDLWLIVHEMVAQGTTVIASTAYLDEAERCDRVLLLHEGLQLGLDAPLAFQGSLEGRVFRLEEAVRQPLDALQAVPGVRAAARFGAAIHLTTVVAEAPSALRDRLRAAGVHAEALEPLEAGFEDVFLDRLLEARHG